MTEAEIIKLFENVPTTHLFRKAKSLIHNDIVAIKGLLKTKITELSPEDFEEASNKVGNVMQLIDYVVKVGIQDDPYLQARTIQNQMKLRWVDFNKYEDFYSYYRNDMLPNVDTKSYFASLRSDIFGCLANIISYCKLSESLLQDEVIDYSAVSELMQISDELSWRFEAMINATADYEQQLFG